MIRLQRTTVWVTAFFALAGLVFIATFILTRNPEGYLLSGAAIAAMFSAASLLLGVIFVWLESAWRMRSRTLNISSGFAVPIFGSTLSAQFRQRRQVLSDRLNIDEPRFCTQAKAPCVSWSFCGAKPDMQQVTIAALREGQVLTRSGSEIRQAAAEHEQALPVVQRSGGLPASCLALVSTAEMNGKSPCTKGQQRTS